MEVNQKYRNIIPIFGILHNDYVSISQQVIPYMETMLGYFDVVPYLEILCHAYVSTVPGRLRVGTSNPLGNYVQIM